MLRSLVGSEMCIRDSYYVLAASLLFLVPTLVLGLLIHQRPDLVLSVMDAVSYTHLTLPTIYSV